MFHMKQNSPKMPLKALKDVFLMHMSPILSTGVPKKPVFDVLGHESGFIAIKPVRDPGSRFCQCKTSLRPT
jgi:hypothetical protein